MTLDLRIGRAEALFASDLPQCRSLGHAEVTAAIALTWVKHGGISGCAALMAAEYGDHPEAAAARMRWALATVARVYPPVTTCSGRSAAR
ncbi:hypothetical protein ACQP2E_16790 [Actinoplanes sp. CA-015351]|uniref:hypothetical protein n=1 Tax=Actinoplanes sp. CA-015351 TaxID=3239897 RepID=UPI003D964BED